MNNKSIVFCIVNAGTNDFTNLTIGSILKFHPNAKIFVVDAFARQGIPFEPAERIVNNVEIIDGITKSETHLPTIDVNQIDYLTYEQKQRLVSVLGNPYTVPFRGSLNHSENIQLAIDTIDSDFILMDSDAPLIRPIDFVDEHMVTIADHDGNPDTRRTNHYLLNVKYDRFIPFIQYINTNILNSLGIKFYDSNAYSEYLSIARVQYGSKKPSVWVETGSVLWKEVIQRQLPYCTISYTQYVDHYEAASYTRLDYERKQEFFKKHLT